METNTKKSRFLDSYKDCHEQFVRYCSALSHCHMDTEDLVQEVLLVTYQNYEKIKEKQKLLHYLIRTAKNKFISGLRKKKVNDNFDQWKDKLLDNGVSAETLIDVGILYKALDQLPYSQKNALILFEINGFSVKEIAKIQNTSEGAIKTKLSRGRKKLALMLNEKKTVSNYFLSVQMILL